MDRGLKYTHATRSASPKLRRSRRPGRGIPIGFTVRQLVEQFGVHRSTVLAHLERRDIPRRPHVAKLTETDIAIAADRYRQGQSLATLAEAFEVNAETIRKSLLRTGVQIRPRRGSSPPANRDAGE